MKVLFIEDNLDFREDVTWFLTEAGHEVTTAETCKEGILLLHAYGQGTFDFVVTDYRTASENTGEEVIRIADQYMIPSLLITSSHLDPSLIENMTTCRGIWRKPFDIPDLVKLIDKCPQQRPLS